METTLNNVLTINGGSSGIEFALFLGPTNHSGANYPEILTGLAHLLLAPGGPDALVFSGGIGANAPVVRSRICEGSGFPGIGLEEKPDRENVPVIS